MLKPLHIKGLVSSKSSACGREEKRQVCVGWCKMWIDFIKLQTNNGCVVFDIDDTLVDDFERIIKSVCSVFHHCIKNRIPVFLITARPDGRENRSLTKQMLEYNGLCGYKRLYMMPQKLENSWENISKFKFAARHHIGQHNFIISCFGDMWTDHMVFPIKSHSLSDMLKTTSRRDCVIWFIDKTCYVKLPESV